jgi:MFS family permease
MPAPSLSRNRAHSSTSCSVARRFSGVLPHVVTGIIIQQVGIGMSIPVLIAWAQLKFPLAHRGVGMGIWTSSFFLGQFTSPWIVARIESLTGSVQGSFTGAGIAALAGSLIAIGWVLAHRRKPKLD